MADQSGTPDYELAGELELADPAQYRALFDETRLKIIDLLLERAATTSELADALGKPKGTVGHHLKVLEHAGLVRVVRTQMVRAIEARYYGRTARTYLFEGRDRDSFDGIGTDPTTLMANAAAEMANLPDESPPGLPAMSSVRYARIPAERAEEWQRRLSELSVEFVSEPRAGDVTFGLVVAIYPTDRPRLPDPGQPR
ncbi:winged helix-turn-helix domain-containing protein [Haloactinopolyspora sp.]|uniref:ArsR/SmtB family transcription factor n=1 Tax=Haloactinopolyspora sp. TaxID=1966353 RepID=UPI0026257876|nr:winged helix-turn-helix domain-containing protein [Haloactinopolyspora sp.]